MHTQVPTEKDYPTFMALIEFFVCIKKCAFCSVLHPFTLNCMSRTPCNWKCKKKNTSLLNKTSLNHFGGPTPESLVEWIMGYSKTKFSAQHLQLSCFLYIRGSEALRRRSVLAEWRSNQSAGSAPNFAELAKLLGLC